MSSTGSAIPSVLLVSLVAVALKHTYLPYPVTPEWCERVREALPNRGDMTRLAEYLDVSTGHLSDILSGKYQTNDLVEPIHEFLKWSPPIPPTASVDAGEIMHGYQRMTQAQRELLDEAMQVLEGASGDQARRTLAEMLKLFRAGHHND